MTDIVTPTVELRVGGKGPFRLSGTSPDEYVFRTIETTGAFYESDMLDALATIPIDSDEIFIDVGANLGNHTVYFAGVMERRVLSVEPEPRNASVLRHNIQQNGLGNLVRTSQVAVGAAEGRVSLEQHIEQNWGAFHTTPGDDIVVTTLPQLVHDDETVGVIKVDVEGDELAVLEGSLRLIERDAPVIAVEVHDPLDVAAVQKLLSPFDYVAVGLFGRSDNLVFASPRRFGDSALRGLTAALALTAQRKRDRTVLAGLDRISHAQFSSGPDMLEKVGRHTSESAKLRRLLGISRRHLADEHEYAKRAAAANRQLRREAQLWQEAYASLARSRALKSAQKLRNSAARTGVVTPVQPASAKAKQKAIRREAARGHATLGARPPRSRGAHLRRLGEEPIRIGIASIPSRVDGLQKVIESLYGQADEICVYLNEFTTVPDFLLDPGIQVYNGPDVGDRGKFLFVDDFEGYYLTCDDDIEYPPYYVAHLIDGIERYARAAAVGWHGSQIKQPFEDYYSAESRRVISFWRGRDQDMSAHILGTGCAGFHTDTMLVRYADFRTENMADIYFALAGQQQKVPFIVLQHPDEAAKRLDLESPSSISGESIAQSTSRLNVRERTNKLVASRRWLYHEATPLVVREPLRVAIIGRVDREHWKKGGILKSAHLTASMLRRHNVHVEMLDLATDPIEDLKATTADVVLVYPGDPERPDFRHVEEVIEHHAERGDALVLANLSYNARPSRTDFIVAKFESWGERYGDRVRLLGFTDELASLRGLERISHLVVALPKTIEVPSNRTADFRRSEGVFVGDYGKLCNERLLDHPVEEWLEAIKHALPGVPIFALSQYRPTQAKKLDIEIRPYVPGPLAEDLAAVRLMVSPFRYCTFEMVPVELAGAGIPIVYRSMEQSLSGYLGAAGVAVDSPDDLASVLPRLYHDPSLWNGLSRAGELRARSADSQHQAAALYLRIAAAHERAFPTRARHG